MNLREILEETRDKLDDRITPYLWQDTELLRYANRAVDRLARGAYLISDGSTAAVCQIALTATAGSEYNKHAKIIKVRWARLTECTYPITVVSLNWLEQHFYNWQTAKPAVPKYLTEDLTTGKITLIPAPDANYTANLVVYRLPLVGLSLTAPGSSPEIPERYHEYILSGILAEAYLKQDAETFDKRLATDYLMIFESQIKKAFRENYINIGIPTTVNMHRGHVG